MSAYYNEFDPFAAQWLRSLIDAGHIAPGDVDERSIEDVQPSDLDGYTQAHFFAGIGGWSLALRMAGVPDTAPIWTGSCPCQPFSNAGKGLADDDARHLWPVFARLISECRPPAVFGEQVASRLGRSWLGSVFADMEAMGYAVAGADLCAAGVSAPHIRQRLWWVGHADDAGLEGRRGVRQRRDERPSRSSGVGRVGLADRDLAGRIGLKECERQEDARGEVLAGADPDGRGVVNPWSDLAWVACSDGRARPIPHAQPALFPLAHGLPNRVGSVRGSGNAIVPQVAAAFIEAACAEVA